jgi:hypothetical protein
MGRVKRTGGGGGGQGRWRWRDRAPPKAQCPRGSTQHPAPRAGSSRGSSPSSHTRFFLELGLCLSAFALCIAPCASRARAPRGAEHGTCNMRGMRVSAPVPCDMCHVPYVLQPGLSPPARSPQPLPHCPSRQQPAASSQQPPAARTHTQGRGQ